MLEARKRGHGRAGVFWQTQGSGKSFSMVFFAQKVLRKVTGNWTFVIVTDRVELDDQIAKTFKAAGAVSQAEGDQCHAASGAQLRELLRGNHRYVFTLIQKFQTPEILCDRPDVVVLTDEAHRSQYDTLALNMRAGLPKAMFLAFTGTPLIAGEERTKEVFGDYVSIYDFQQSIEDGATLPLFYENRTPELQLVNPDLNEDMYDLIEEADLDPEEEAKLEAGARPPVPPHHSRRPAGDGGRGHREAFPRAGLHRQGDGRVHRQGHCAQDVRQGAQALVGGDRKGREGAGTPRLPDEG